MICVVPISVCFRACPVFLILFTRWPLSLLSHMVIMASQSANFSGLAFEGQGPTKSSANKQITSSDVACIVYSALHAKAYSRVTAGTRDLESGACSFFCLAYVVAEPSDWPACARAWRGAGACARDQIRKRRREKKKIIDCALNSALGIVRSEESSCSLQ